jgi:DNA adenine methylase
MKFLRYPGGKSKILPFLKEYLPSSTDIKGKYIEPFIGGGSIFFYVNPSRAILSDLNEELIHLYKGIQKDPLKVWEIFSKFPKGKSSYYLIRNTSFKKKPLPFKAARILYLNRTCFKGMWRHNKYGKFNVGYGGEERRKVIKKDGITNLSKIFKKAEFYHSDFSDTLLHTESGDFIFLDPPYKPGEKDLEELHYISGKFTLEDQKRLHDVIQKITSQKNIRWAMTNSSHPEILKLYKKYKIKKIPIGTGNRPGIQTKNSKEILITNY